jgi:hypothetical protein
VIKSVLAPWSTPGATWRRLVHFLLDAPLGFAGCLMVGVLVAMTISTVVVLPVSVVAFGLLFVLARLGARLERSRFAALLDVAPADPVVPLRPASWWRRMVEVVTTVAR